MYICLFLKVIYLFILAVLGLCVWAFFGSCKWGLLLVRVHRLLIAVTSLVSEHGSLGQWA